MTTYCQRPTGICWCCSNHLQAYRRLLSAPPPSTITCILSVTQSRWDHYLVTSVPRIIGEYFASVGHGFGLCVGWLLRFMATWGRSRETYGFLRRVHGDRELFWKLVCNKMSLNKYVGVCFSDIEIWDTPTLNLYYYRNNLAVFEFRSFSICYLWSYINLVCLIFWKLVYCGFIRLQIAHERLRYANVTWHSFPSYEFMDGAQFAVWIYVSYMLEIYVGAGFARFNSLSLGQDSVGNRMCYI